MSLVADCNPTEFELFCLETLKAFGEREKLSDFNILHNQKIKTYDGTYQIDILCEFVALNIKFKVIAECKMYKKPVERRVVSELHDKIESLGASKGIIISTSGFQSGAVDYAKNHGISLMQIVNNRIFYASQSVNMDYLYFKQLESSFLPKIQCLLWDNDHYYPYDCIYPTTEMIEQAQSKARQLLISTAFKNEINYDEQNL